MRGMTLTLGLLLAALAPAAAERAFEVAELSGKLSGGGRDFAPGDRLPAGTPVSLEAGGRAVIRVNGEGAVLLKGPASFTPKKGGVDIALGGILSVLPRLKSLFRISTPAVVASVRGTDFYAEARHDQTYICLCEGKLELKASAHPGRRQRMTSHTHTAGVFRAERGGLSRAPAGLEGHSENDRRELRALAARLK